MSEDKRLIDLLKRLEMLDLKSIDAALEAQREAEAKGKVAPLVRVLVHKGYVSYGQMERLRAHLAGTEMACRKRRIPFGSLNSLPWVKRLVYGTRG